MVFDWDDSHLRGDNAEDYQETQSKTINPLYNSTQHPFHISDTLAPREFEGNS